MYLCCSPNLFKSNAFRLVTKTPNAFRVPFSIISIREMRFVWKRIWTATSMLVKRN